jgi:hypothetical protein
MIILLEALVFKEKIAKLKLPFHFLMELNVHNYIDKLEVRWFGKFINGELLKKFNKLQRTSNLKQNLFKYLKRTSFVTKMINLKDFIAFVYLYIKFIINIVQIIKRNVKKISNISRLIHTLLLGRFSNGMLNIRCFCSRIASNFYQFECKRNLAGRNR